MMLRNQIDQIIRKGRGQFRIAVCYMGYKVNVLAQSHEVVIVGGWILEEDEV